MNASAAAAAGAGLYRGMDKEALDTAFNNSAVVPDLPSIRASWAHRSAAALALPNALDQHYGDGPRHRVDLFFASERNAPTLVYMHGGYWQANDKENYRFVAEGPVSAGLNVAVLEYTIAPNIRMDEMVEEIRLAATWLARNLGTHGADPSRVIMGGHSAGGHLTAMVASMPEIWCGLAISGLFDLQPIRLSYLNEKLGLDAAEAERNSPLRRLSKKAAPLMIAYGTAELPELQRQSVEFGEAWIGTGLPGEMAPIAGANHFTVVEALARPDGLLLGKLKAMIGRLGAS